MGLFANLGRAHEATNLEYVLSYDGSYYTVSGLGAEKRTKFKIPELHDEKPVKAIDEGALKIVKNC